MDWKEKLALLRGVSQSDEKDREQVPVRKRQGVVYSTNPDYVYEDDSLPETITLPASCQRLHISMERAGRGGKTVTLVRGFVGGEDDLVALAKFLKTKLGVGGTAKDGEIVIQGDHRSRLSDVLVQLGYGMKGK